MRRSVAILLDAWTLCLWVRLLIVVVANVACSVRIVVVVIVLSVHGDRTRLPIHLSRFHKIKLAAKLLELILLLKDAFLEVLDVVVVDGWLARLGLQRFKALPFNFLPDELCTISRRQVRISGRVDRWHSTREQCRCRISAVCHNTIYIVEHGARGTIVLGPGSHPVNFLHLHLRLLWHADLAAHEGTQ